MDIMKVKEGFVIIMDGKRKKHQEEYNKKIGYVVLVKIVL